MEIEKRIVLKASRERVWRAISDAKEFGAWFGVELDGPFVAGRRLVGTIVPTKADPEVAKQQEPHAGKSFEITVDRVEPMTLLSFRWHPFAVDPAIDYSKEPSTLVSFELADGDAAGATRLTVRETGFENVPLARRAKAFTANEHGWEMQTKLIEKYLAARS